MPFGLTNAPTSFARAMHKVLQQVESRECTACFMDDCCVHSHTFEAHLEDLKATLNALQSGGLRLNILKCHFGYASAKCLGHVLSVEGLHTDREKNEAILSWRTPSCPSDIKRFLGYATIIETLFITMRSR